MELSRRKFFRGLAAAPLVVVAPSLPKLPDPPADRSSLWTMTWGKKGVKKMIRHGIPVPQWRKLYEGVKPLRGVS